MYIERDIEKAILAHCREALKGKGAIVKAKMVREVIGKTGAKHSVAPSSPQVLTVFHRLIDDGRIEGMFENGVFGVAAINAKQKPEASGADPRQAGFGWGE